MGLPCRKVVIAGEVLAVWRPDEQHPYGMSPILTATLREAIDAGQWGQGTILRKMSAEIADSPTQLSWWQRYESASATPSAFISLFVSRLDIDLRAELPRIRAPVLLTHDLPVGRHPALCRRCPRRGIGRI